MILLIVVAGYVMIALALMAIASSLTRWYSGLWISGLMVLAAMTMMIIYYFAKLSSVSATMHDLAAKQGGDALAEIAKMPSIYAMAPLGWGAMALLIGAIVVLTAAALQEPVVSG